MADEFFLSRWSRLKSRARQDEAAAPEAKAPVAPPTGMPPEVAATSPAEVPANEAAKEPQPLPPVESLTADSDFTPFMKAEVDPDLRRQALRTLFRDPRFNVMDGLDVYIDDFSKPDPLPPEWLAQLTQTARLGLYQEPDPEAANEEPAASEEVATAGEEAVEAEVSDTPAAIDAASEVDDSSSSGPAK
jgi:hypothetical protein